MGKGEGGDWMQLATSVGGAIAGTMIGGPAGGAMGWQLGSQGGQLLNGTTGMQSSGEGVAAIGQKAGNIGATALNVGTAAGSGTAKGTSSEGFSGIVSSPYSDGMDVSGTDVGGTNAWGQALGRGKGNPTIPTENGFSKLNSLITKSMDTAGAITKSQDSGQGDLQAMQMAPVGQMASPMNLTSVLAAQLMNPAAQNRIAFMHPGRM